MIVTGFAILQFAMHLLQSEIIGSQSGVIDLQNDSCVVDSCINDLECKQCPENDFIA